MNIFCKAIRIILDGGRTNHAAKEVIRHQRNLAQVGTHTFRGLMEVYFKTSKDSTAVRWAVLKHLKKTESFGAGIKKLDDMFKEVVSDQRNEAASLKKLKSLQSKMAYCQKEIKKAEKIASNEGGVAKTLGELALQARRVQMQQLYAIKGTEESKLEDLHEEFDDSCGELVEEVNANPEQLPWKSLYVSQRVKNNSTLGRIFKETPPLANLLGGIPS